MAVRQNKNDWTFAQGTRLGDKLKDAPWWRTEQHPYSLDYTDANNAPRNIAYQQRTKEKYPEQAKYENPYITREKQLITDASRTNTRNMDANTRGAMKRHYYREERRAQGLAAG